LEKKESKVSLGKYTLNADGDAKAFVRFLNGFISLSRKKECSLYSGQEFVKTVISDNFTAKDSIYLYIWVSY
jgi:hypothetical protein